MENNNTTRDFSWPLGTCKRCGRHSIRLMPSNNPLIGNGDNNSSEICLDCLIGADHGLVDPHNLNQVDLLLRTYNIPFNPELWISFVDENDGDGIRALLAYCGATFVDPSYQPNLMYSTKTADLWSKVDKEWQKKRSFIEVLQKINSIRDSYVDRGRLKWGEQYGFEDLIKLDSIYTKTLKANRITNPLQKEAVKTLCKLQLEMDDAIRLKDAKAIKDFSNAWSTFAKQADLETMINETKTNDITTVSELYDYMEKHDFNFKFYDGFPRDEVDRALQDIQGANRRLILESTGLQQTLEDMIKQKQAATENAYAEQITSADKLKDLLNFEPTDNEIETETDEDALSESFAAEEQEQDE